MGAQSNRSKSRCKEALAQLAFPFPVLAALADRCSQAILASARAGDLAQLSLSLESELPSCQGVNGETPLHLAAGNGQVLAAQALLNARATMSGDNMGRAPLHFAAQGGYLATAGLLLEAQAYLELEDATQRTPLHHSARSGHVEVTELLLSAKARPDARDGDLNTPLHHTARSDLLFNVSFLLLTRGADFELEDAIGFRPLHYACTFSQSLTAMRLLDLSADVWAMDRSGWSPVIHAAAVGEHQFVQELVTRIAKPKEFVQPDPSKFIVQGDGTIGGIPALVLIGVVVLLLSIAVVIPGCRIIRRFRRLKKPYEVEDADESADDFITELFAYLGEQPGQLSQLAQEWDRVNVNAISDLHRVKTKGA
ncbi:ankrd52 [Symbiodinium sp. CCMP2592]|nr:ankrd52 [Symbiodinium sp. CCMP2592]